jgi:hypothetical protein
LIGLQMIQAAPGKGRDAVPFAGINRLAYGALTVAGPSAVAPREAPAVPGPKDPGGEALADFAGTYDFGGSVSSRDRQGLVDGKNGWLGIETFVAMEPEGLRINRPSPGGPATRAGVTAGDLVTELDGTPLKGLALDDVLARLRGPANTPIRMKIVHKGRANASDLSVMRAARRASAVQLQVRIAPGGLVAEATGAWPILEFEKGKATPLVATSGSEFTVDDDDHTRIAFVRDAAGKVTELILNPGPWEQKAAMIAAGRK